MKEKIEAVLDKIRPALDAHGGDVELIKIDSRKHTVSIRFLGTCDHCAISTLTLKYLVEREIRSAYPQITEVIAV